MPVIYMDYFGIKRKVTDKFLFYGIFQNNAKSFRPYILNVLIILFLLLLSLLTAALGTGSCFESKSIKWLVFGHLIIYIIFNTSNTSFRSQNKLLDGCQTNVNRVDGDKLSPAHQPKISSATKQKSIML